ncbi:MAG: alpha/beta fold hydrolase [Methylococcaceae bacterium]|nr:alpha/beta fold hydrolase [Methylococcaceae bacterium]
MPHFICRRGTAFLLVACVPMVMGFGNACAQDPVAPAYAVCNARVDRCMELGRIRFEQYQQKKIAEIRQKSRNYRLPSSPIGFLHPRRTEYSVLLIHGLNDSPFYMGDLAALLYEEGFNVVSILLPGHGTDTRELSRVTAEQWRAEVETGLRIASFVGRKSIVGGFSLGGALAIDAALRHPEIHALLLFAPAIRLPYFDALYRLACLPVLRGLSINAKMPVNPVKYKYRMMNGICQVHRLLNNQLGQGELKDAEMDAGPEMLYESAARLKVPAFGTMTYLDQRVSAKAILDFFGELDAPAMLATFGPAPGDRTVRLSNGADIVHISDQDLPHSYLVRRTNRYNGQANPYFDVVAQKLRGFLTKYL